MSDAPAPLWATLTDIENLLGVTVDAKARMVAVNAIELTTGAIEAVPRPLMYDRDRYWLKLAVCYQAAWIASQPDYLERNAVTAVSQDGQSATGANAEWLILAPLARKALKRVSWRGPRKMAVGTDRTTSFAGGDDSIDRPLLPGVVTTGGPIGPDPLGDISDYGAAWSPLS
ncbi:MAG: hypothetical protein JWO98_5328 [Frankiales bacterium]|nr:hypothetical protein [Frankiales bacterium]